MMLNLEPIKAREAAATAGPWTLDEPYEVDDKGTRITFINGPEWWYDGGLIESQADAAFIASARSDVPALVAEVERLRERIEFLESVLVKDGWDGPMMSGKWPARAGEATTALSEDE